MISIITKKWLIENIAEHYEAQYGLNTVIGNRLRAKKPTTSKEVLDIVGSKGWIENTCDECQKDCYWLAVFEHKTDGQDPRLCEDCLRRALEKIDRDVKGYW